MRRNLAFYLAVLGLFGGGIWFVLDRGADLAGGSKRLAELAPAAEGEAAPATLGGILAGLVAGFAEALRAPLGALLLQVVVIVVAARALGALARFARQPAVVGEMIAGILLGPSLLGRVAPVVHGHLFGSEALGGLELLSQVGVVLFLFVVGVDFDLGHLRGRASSTLLVGHASMVVPFFLGSAAAIPLFLPFAPAGVPFGAFALFVGVAMSVTAFPVLVRILEERGLAATELGTTAIAAAAAADATAWCLLAVVVALARATSLVASFVTVVLAVALVLVLSVGIHPLLARRFARRPLRDENGSGYLAAILAFVFAVALAAHLIGIHALFGAFLAGVALPASAALREFLRLRLESFSSVLLLPLFFAFTGLRTQVGLLDDARSWLVCAAIVAVAVVGKLGGTMLAARWARMSWRDSFALGALMNTRGLVELVVLNVGYDLGILSPRMFTMLVLMALATTFMTGPLLDLARVGGARRPAAADRPARPDR